MARKRIPRNLPPLEDIFSDVAVFSQQLSKQLALLQELRKAARRLRKRDPVPFYSMREVGLYFKLPLRTVALTYETLEMEGLLTRIRGSQTLLVGKVVSPRSPVRGIVGIPVWLHALVVSPYSRALHIEMEERLRESGFVADFIFFRGEEIHEPGFVNRLLHHNLDQVVWHTPHPLATNVLLSLKDHGIRQVTVQSTESRTSIPVPTYLMDWQPAYREMARKWREDGVRKVIIPDPVYLPSKRALKAFVNTLARFGLEYEIIEGTPAALQHKVLSCKRRSSLSVAFMDQQGADTICNEEPVIIEEISQACRIAFCRGPIRLPYFNHRPVQADIIRFSPVETADQIVQDLIHAPTISEGVLHIFQADYEAHVELSTQYEAL